MITLNFEGRKKVELGLNIAPLIDIVFLLLIFFMLSSNFINQPGLKLTLPAAQTGTVSEHNNVIVYITEDNLLYMNDIPVSIDNLKNSLEDFFVHANSKDVVIQADEKIDLGLAVKVMDISKQAQAEGLIISVDQKSIDNEE